MIALLLSLLAALFPFHTTAWAPVDADGWRVTIQVRPYSSSAGTYTWAGGYLSDGTFVQSGIVQPSESMPVARAFVWFMTPGSVPLYSDLAVSAVGSWHRFEALRRAGTWRFMVDGHEQVTHQGPALSVLQVDQENWMPQWGPFPTAAVRKVAVLTRGLWSPPHMTHSPSSQQCGQEQIRATPGLNLVFRWTGGQSRPLCYDVL